MWDELCFCFGILPVLPDIVDAIDNGRKGEYEDYGNQDHVVS